jgi:xylose isomerase
MDVKKAMLTMQVVVEQKGLAPGGLNFDAKIRRESTDLEDYFIGHIGAMDTFARGLKAVGEMKKEATYDKMIKERYATFDAGIGKDIEGGKAGFKELEAYILKNGEAKRTSGKQEAYEVLYNYYV